MKYEEINGDLIELALQDKFNVIAHGCNCFCTQKSGIAKSFAEVFHTNNYSIYPGENPSRKGDINKLGTFEATYVLPGPDNKIRNLRAIINCYTQYYNRTIAPKDWVGPLLDYEALTLCMRKINHEFKGMTIGLPLIGCGLAGGDWEKVKPIIQRELKDCNVTIVIYDK